MSGLSAYSRGKCNNQQPVIRCLALMGEVQVCKPCSMQVVRYATALQKCINGQTETPLQYHDNRGLFVTALAHFPFWDTVVYTSHCSK